MRLLTCCLVVVAVLVNSQSAKAGLPACSADHCSEIDKETNHWCIEYGFAGRRYPAHAPQGRGMCLCTCSCLVAGTLITMSDGSLKRIEDISAGDYVFSPFKSDNRARVARIMMSNSTGFPVLRITLSNGEKIIASANHLFLSEKGEILSARKIELGDRLSDGAVGNEVIQIELVPEHNGMLYNFEMQSSEMANRDHFYVANGVLSGDFIVQSGIDSEKWPNENDNKRPVYPNCDAEICVQVGDMSEWCAGSSSSEIKVPVFSVTGPCFCGCQ